MKCILYSYPNAASVLSCSFRDMQSASSFLVTVTSEETNKKKKLVNIYANFGMPLLYACILALGKCSTGSQSLSPWLEMSDVQLQHMKFFYFYFKPGKVSLLLLI